MKKKINFLTKGSSGKSNARIDNTFSCDHGPRAPLRHCFSYVRELSRLRNITDFEATNEKRLMRRNYNFDDSNRDVQIVESFQKKILIFKFIFYYFYLVLYYIA